MNTYHLVTTPIYETWSNNSINLLAGQWCEIYRDNKIAAKYKYQVADYHWDDRKKFFKDSFYLRSLNSITLSVLTKELNLYHKVKYPERFWKILIGPWLHKFIHIIFDKYQILSKINNHYKIDSSFIINLDSEYFVPFDTKMFSTFMRDDLWHHYIFSKLLLNFFTIKYKFIEVSKNINYPNKEFIHADIEESVKYNYLKKFDLFFKKIFSTRKHEYFIKNSGFSITDEIKLNFILNKSLSLNFFTPEKNFKVKKLDRGNFLNNLDTKNDEFFKILLFMTKEQLPKIFLESFNELKESVEKLNWPDKPKKIFTAYAYEFDEHFKLYTAKNILKGTKFIIGQHGGFFGMAKWNLPEEHQINISDKFLSWGWQDNKNIMKDGFAFINFSTKVLEYKKNKKAIFITHPVERYSCKTQAWPTSSSQSYKYMNSHIEFINNLKKDIQKNFVFRILRKHDDLFKTGYIDRVKNSFYHKDFGGTKLSKVLDHYKLAFIVNNSTTLLYTLSINFPTVLFWDEGYFELNETSAKYFNELKTVGILHTSPLDAANHINKIWSNIEIWWESDKVQKIRKIFCDNYVKRKSCKIHELKKLIIMN
jgi:putative transferase (TIGR04331 family)